MPELMEIDNDIESLVAEKRRLLLAKLAETWQERRNQAEMEHRDRESLFKQQMAHHTRFKDRPFRYFISQIFHR